MISQGTLHGLTDRLARQYEILRTYIGPEVTSVTGTADTIGESLHTMYEDELISDGDKAGMAAIAPALENLQEAIDVDTLAKAYYKRLVRRLEGHLATAGSVYNGFEDFAFDNANTRYASHFCRLAALMGYTFASPAMCFHDGDDILGQFTATGAGTGTWTAANPIFDADVLDTFGTQPCSTVEVEANGAINVADDLTVTVHAREAVNGTEIALTATFSAGDADGTTYTMTSSSPYAAYVYEISSVHITDGTAADSFYVRFLPIRTTALD